MASILNVGVLSSSRIHKHTYRQSMWCNVMEWEEMKNSQALPRVDKAYWWLKFDTFLPVDWFFLMPCHFCGWRNLLINNDKHFHFRKKLERFPIYSIHYVSWFWVSAKQRSKNYYFQPTRTRQVHSQNSDLLSRQTKFKTF